MVLALAVSEGSPEWLSPGSPRNWGRLSCPWLWLECWSVYPPAPGPQLASCRQIAGTARLLSLLEEDQGPALSGFVL